MIDGSERSPNHVRASQPVVDHLQTTVVIPNWNGRDHLEECLESLRRQSLPAAKIIVVDNASSDGSVSLIHSLFPEVEVIQMPCNGGFSYAVNEGIRRAGTPYVALLNNDTRVDERWLEELVVAADKNQADFAASLMLIYDRPDIVNSAGDYYVLRVPGAFNRGVNQTADDYQSREWVLGACAGAALYRRSAFDDVGLFDEDFFLIYEDIDWDLRALIAGKHCLYVPQARVWHKWGASIRAQSLSEMRRLAARNIGIATGKNVPLPLLVVPLVFHPWLVLRQTVLAYPANPRLALKALGRLVAFDRQFCRGFVMGLRKRHAVWARRKAPRGLIYRWLVLGRAD